MRTKAMLSVFLASLLIWYPVLNLTAGNLPLGKVVPRGPADLNGTRLTLETTLFAGDIIATAADGLALVLLPQGDQVHVGPASTVAVSDTAEGILAQLERGAVVVRSGSGQRIFVRAGGLLVTPSGAAHYEVALAEPGVVVAAQAGEVTVQGSNQAVAVPAGKVMRFELGSVPLAPVVAGGGSQLAGLAAILVSLLISTAVTVPISVVLANKAKDDARQQACQQIKQSISPAVAATIVCK